MLGNGTAFDHVSGVLAPEDIDFLKGAVREQLEREQVPCFSLIDHLDSTPVKKIKALVEERLGEPVYYLNDFYIFTDSSFKTSWHMDTELFSFDRAVNAWILLAPDRVDGPLAFIKGLNEPSGDYFHSVNEDGEMLNFSEYHTRRRASFPASEIEARQVGTPQISRGDVLLIDPRRFHKTSVTTAKHALAIKFVLKGGNGFLSPQQVPAILWPEVKTFNDLVKGAADWDEVLDRTRSALGTEEGKARLSSGFFPEKFPLYLESIRSI